MSPTIYSIGHSNHALEDFLKLLNLHGIQSIADVRSTPYSRWQPQYNQAELRAALAYSGISYEPFCDELGARPSERSCYENGRVVYDLLAGLSSFNIGLEQLTSIGAVSKVAMMCAERDPLECHRTILIGRVLTHRGNCVVNILGDGSVETWKDSVQRLLRLRKLDQPSLFETQEELIARAFLEQEQEIAFSTESATGSL